MRMLAATLLTFATLLVDAQASTAQSLEEPSTTVTVRADSLRDTSVSTPRATRPITANLIASSIYDSNIQRDEKNLGSYGLVTGLGARYQDREIRPLVQLSYEIARHAYTRGEEWDRISHDLNLVLARRLSRKFILETIGEIALKGSSEDRDIGNQYIFLPRLNYRISLSQRLRLYGAYRVRRYDTGTDRDAANRYAGLEYRKLSAGGRQWGTGYRYETNSARSERRSYTRRTYFTAWTAPLRSRDQVVLDLQYRSQRYDKRPVSVGDIETPRHDHRFLPSLEWVHPLARDVALVLDYAFEYRTSNDPSKGYRDHTMTLTTRYQF